MKQRLLNTAIAIDQLMYVLLTLGAGQFLDRAPDL